MSARLVIAVLLALPALAGCVAPTTSLDGSGTLPLDLLAPATPLWRDPQNAPHPMFGFPTLTNVPDGPDVPAWWRPIAPRALPETIQGLEHLAAAPEGVASGAGIALFGSLAVVPGFGEPTSLVDISDPTAPRLLGILPGATNHRGAAMIPYPDGRLVATLATPSGIEVWDVTDPRAPERLAALEPPTGGHKVAIVPGTPIVYNANSRGAGGTANRLAPQGQTEIYDLTDPEKPVLVQAFPNGYGCHHIFFWIDAAQERYRALCAGMEVTQIWDIADPRNPEIIVSVPVHHGNPALPSGRVSTVWFSHFAALNDDGTILVVGDETGGGSLPGGCDVGVETQARRVSGPLGNVYFYDVRDERNPRLMGWFSPTTVLPDTTSCTAHHGRLVPDPEGRDMLAMAFYGGGVALIDFSDPADPRLVDQWNPTTDTWEVWYYNGYLFTGDLKRGFDVLTLR